MLNQPCWRETSERGATCRSASRPRFEAGEEATSCGAAVTEIVAGRDAGVNMERGAYVRNGRKDQNSGTILFDPFCIMPLESHIEA